MKLKWLKIYLGTQSIGEWLANNMDPGTNIGVDPLLITISEWKKIDQQLQSAADDIKLIGHNTNLGSVNLLSHFTKVKCDSLT